jgi:hypothetical protein
MDNYTWNEKTGQLLVFANTARVWRYNTKGDYWLYEHNTKRQGGVSETGGSACKRDVGPKRLGGGKYVKYAGDLHKPGNGIK